jgi:hypothetical protein
MKESLQPDFRAADVGSFPPLSALPDDSVRCLCTLWVAKEAADCPWITPAQVSDGLRDVYGVSVPRQRAEALLSRARASGMVARRVSGGRRYYQVMDAGITAVRNVETSVLFITPEQSLTSIRAVEELLGTLRGEVRICDPYTDGRTLDWLASCSRATRIQLLTTNIKNRTTTFARDLLAFNRQHNSLGLEIRVLAAGVLHDRYVIDDSQLLLFGTSLNNLGTKQTFVVSAGEDLRNVVTSAFDDGWSKASPA